MPVMQAEVIAIGSELTSGHTVNINASYLAKQLETLGISCARHIAVSDTKAAIIDTLTEALRRSRVVIVTGGLGPTFDDITMEAIARATGRRLVMAPAIATRIRAFYRQHRRRLNRLALRQALVPVGAVALSNPVGTAPGVWLPLARALLIALPGVPQEMRAIMEQSIVPRLRRWEGRAAILSRTIRTVGLVELQIQEVLARLRIPKTVQVGLYPHLMAVDVRLTVSGAPARTAAHILDRLDRQLRRRLGEAVYGTDTQTLEEIVGQALTQRHRTLAVAESCTGGLIADRLTNVPGSSRYVLVSVVAYHNRIKESLVGVRPSQLARFGAVSAPVARAMAQGIRLKAGADIGLAVTGIAGPTGATPRKPVGLVYLALADHRTTSVRRHDFHGDRLAIKHQAAQMALDWLRRWLRGQT